MVMVRDGCNLARSQLVDAALTEDLRPFCLLYGEWPVLVVAIPEGEGGFEQELGAAEAATAMSYRTEPSGFTRARGARIGLRGADRVSELASFLGNARGFALCLRKRQGAGSPFPDRISVGRARNRDVVLRHPSVSKFHAWFEGDDVGGLHLADSDSTNTTGVNGQVLVPRTKVGVAPGDFIRFGAVEGFLCGAKDLWELVRGGP